MDKSLKALELKLDDVIRELDVNDVKESVKDKVNDTIDEIKGGIKNKADETLDGIKGEIAQKYNKITSGDTTITRNSNWTNLNRFCWK